MFVDRVQMHHADDAAQEYVELGKEILEYAAGLQKSQSVVQLRNLVSLPSKLCAVPAFPRNRPCLKLGKRLLSSLLSQA